MDSRERVFKTLGFEEPDRVPIDFWAAPEAFEKLKRYFGVGSTDEVLDRIDADIRYIDGPRYVGPELKTHPDGSQNDIWGVPRQKNLPFGKPEDVAAEVESVVRRLKPGGGFIIGTAHNIQADTPIENIAALLGAYRSRLRY